MGIIKKTLSAKPDRSAVSIIARGNRFSGDVTAVGRMHIDGTFEGSIVSSNGVSVGRHGCVKGTIKAPKVNVSGLLEGEMHCNEIHIESGGEVNGLIVCHKLSIDDDGIFIGERRTVEAVVTPEPAGLLSSDLVSDMMDALPDKIVLSTDDD